MKIKYVDSLPDLITPEDYHQSRGKKKVRIRIRTTADGVEILGDSMYVKDLEHLLEQMDAGEIQVVLCG